MADDTPLKAYIEALARFQTQAKAEASLDEAQKRQIALSLGFEPELLERYDAELSRRFEALNRLIQQGRWREAAREASALRRLNPTDPRLEAPSARIKAFQDRQTRQGLIGLAFLVLLGAGTWFLSLAPESPAIPEAPLDELAAPERIAPEERTSPAETRRVEVRLEPSFQAWGAELAVHKSEVVRYRLEDPSWVLRFDGALRRPGFELRRLTLSLDWTLDGSSLRQRTYAALQESSLSLLVPGDELPLHQLVFERGTLPPGELVLSLGLQAEESYPAQPEDFGARPVDLSLPAGRPGLNLQAREYALAERPSFAREEWRWVVLHLGVINTGRRPVSRLNLQARWGEGAAALTQNTWVVLADQTPLQPGRSRTAGVIVRLPNAQDASSYSLSVIDLE